MVVQAMYGLKYCRVDCSISWSSFSVRADITAPSSLTVEFNRQLLIASMLLVGTHINVRARFLLFSGVRADFLYVVQVGEAVYRSLAFSTRVCLSETLFCT